MTCWEQLNIEDVHLYVCVWVCVGVRVCACVCVSVYVYVYVHVHVLVCVVMYSCIGVYVLVDVDVYVFTTSTFHLTRTFMHEGDGGFDPLHHLCSCTIFQSSVARLGRAVFVYAIGETVLCVAIGVARASCLLGFQQVALL